jgi:hypothetical protein
MRRDLHWARRSALDLASVEQNFGAVPGELIAARRQYHPEPAIVIYSHLGSGTRRADGYHPSRDWPDWPNSELHGEQGP